MSTVMIPDTNKPDTYWSVIAEDGAILRADVCDEDRPFTGMAIGHGRLAMEAVVPATNRTTAIAAARIAWRDLAANLEGGM